MRPSESYLPPSGQRPSSTRFSIRAACADARFLADADRGADEVRTRFGQLTTLFLNAGIVRRMLVPSVGEAAYGELFRHRRRRCSAASTSERRRPLPTGE